MAVNELLCPVNVSVVAEIVTTRLTGWREYCVPITSQVPVIELAVVPPLPEAPASLLAPVPPALCVVPPHPSANGAATIESATALIAVAHAAPRFGFLAGIATNSQVLTDDAEVSSRYSNPAFQSPRRRRLTHGASPKPD